MSINSQNLTRFLISITLWVILGWFSDFSYGQSDLRIPPIRDVILDSHIEQPVDLDRVQDNFAVSTYISAVTQKIERIIFSWPKNELGHRIYGSITVVSIISVDGSLLDVYPRRTSGNKKLIDAALKIVKLATPFPPPPQSILQLQKSVRFSRTFHFE